MGKIRDMTRYLGVCIILFGIFLVYLTVNHVDNEYLVMLSPVCEDKGYVKATDYKYCNKIDNNDVYKVECDGEHILTGVLKVTNDYKCIETNKWGECIDKKRVHYSKSYYSEKYSNYGCDFN